MADLELKLLGGLSLHRHGHPVSEVKTRKGQALICYLAVTRQPASRSALAGLFWSELPQADAQMNLRQVLIRLKPVLPYLVVTRETLAFNAEASYALDVAEFEAKITVRADLDHLQRAVDLFQGDFLEGFYLADAPLFDEWMLAQRARLRALALGGLEILFAHFAGQADYETALRYARRVLALEPWQEETHRAVMRLLARTGHRNAALAQYETCRASLAAELGVEPDPATLRLREEIKGGTLDGPELDTADQIARQLPGPGHNLPAQTTSLVGRDQELAALAGYLADPKVRLLTILGLGGMGKTRLALAAAAAQLDGDRPAHHFPNGVFFAALAGLESPDQLVTTIAVAVNLRFLAGSDPKAQLFDYLRQKTMLLVLDNFEHLRVQAGLIDEILRVGVGVKVLVTSREKLNLQAEQLFPIGGLAYPVQAADITPSGYGAIQLFCERAVRVRPSFRLTPDNQQPVIDICRLVQGMPLGIVLAAAWLDMYSPSEIATEIRASLDFLESQMADLPERQRSLRAAFNHAWRLLPEQERIVFQCLSIFRGGFTRLAAQRVTGASARDLQGLVNKSLLTVSVDGRYDVHELLRQFAAEKLAAVPQNEARMRERHSAHYCDFLHEQTHHWNNARQLGTLAAVTREADNLQQAWQWALDHGEFTRLASAMESWAWYHTFQGRFAEGENAFQTLGQRLENSASGQNQVSPDHYLVWARALAWQGSFALNNLSALDALRDSLRLIEGLELANTDVCRGKAFVLKVMADRYYSLDRKSARQHCEHGLALYRACDDHWGIASCLGSLGHLDWATGNYAQAEARIQASLAMHRARGDLREQAGSLNSLAWLYQHVGRLEEAVGLHREGLVLCQQLGDRSALAHMMANVAFRLLWQGQFDGARQYADASLAICLEMGHRGLEGYTRLAICMVQLFTGRYEPARREGAQSLAGVRASGAHGEEATVHWVLGCLALVQADYAEARLAFAESRRLYEEVQDNFVGLALSGPGYVACREGRFAQARSHFMEAMQYSLALKDYIYLVAALPGVALYMGQTGKTARALETWALALCQPFMTNSHWHAEVVGQPLEDASAALQPDERLAARERGQCLNIWEAAAACVAELQRDSAAESVSRPIHA